MTRINFELNITLRCNLECPNCNRHCHLKPKWAEDSDMTITQVWQFVDALRDGPVKAKRVKVAGGEPFIHPDFVGIHRILTDAVDNGLIEKIKIDSNGTLPIPDVTPHPAVRWSGRKPSRKAHLPTLWSPTDLGLPIKYPCSMPRKCGISLDNRGYLPCSHAIGIVRTFGWDTAYWTHDEACALMAGLAEEPFFDHWYMDRLCEHCVFAGPEAWRKEHCKPLDQITDEEKQPTKTWAGPMGFCVCTCRGGPKDGHVFTAKQRPEIVAFAFNDANNRRMLHYRSQETLDNAEVDFVFDGFAKLPKR